MNDNSKIDNKLFWAVSFSLFTAMIGLGIVSPLMANYAKSFGGTGLMIGIVFAAFPTSRIVLMPIIGSLSDRKGRKKFLLTGLFGYGIIGMCYPFASSLVHLFWIRLFHGIASAMVIPVAMAFVGDKILPGKEGEIMGKFSMAVFIGFAVGPLLGGGIAGKFGSEWAFFSMSAITFCAFFIACFFMPDEDFKPKQHTNKDSLFSSIFNNPVMLSIVIFRMLRAIGQAAIISFFPLYSIKIGLSVAQTGFLLTANIMVTGVLQGFFGKLADKYNRLLIMAVCSLVVSALMFVLPFVTQFLHILAIFSLMGVFSAGAMASALSVAVIEGRNIGAGKAMGIFNSGMSLGMIIAPLILGIILDKYDMIAVFRATGIIGIVGTFSLVPIFRATLNPVTVSG